MNTRAQQPKTIAIDFDDTFTADPVLWVAFVEKARQLGHKVIMVTARPRTDINRDAVYGFLRDWNCDIPVSFTERMSKARYMQELGTKVDIWIDDYPASIVMES